MNKSIHRLRAGLLFTAMSLVLAGATSAATPAASKAAATAFNSEAGQTGVTKAAVSKVDIPYKEFTLANGLRVIVHEDHKAPIVAVNLWYHVGSKDERPGKTGFAHLYEHLMFEGSENHKSKFFDPFEKVGATNQNGTTNTDRTNFFENVPTTALDMALWMESDRMGHLLVQPINAD